MENHYSYQAALEISERNNWRIEDIIGGEKRLDFDKPFMPESLARVSALAFLSAEEKRTLNQIRRHEYLAMFGLVEEFILPYVIDHARPKLSGDDYRARALLQFAGEEAKHIHLFKRFRQEFEAGFGSACEFIGPAEDVKKFVLSHSPLGVGITILHIEWMTSAPLHRGRERQSGTRSAVQEYAQAPLAGGVPAHEARHVSRRGTGGKRLRK